MTKPAVVFRSIALFAILYQFRLIADDLADTSVFAVTIIAAFIIAVVLAEIMKPLAAVISIGLIPWIVRFFYAIPRLLIPGGDYDLAVTLDSLLLNFDRNNFVTLLPFYWAAATTWFSLRSRLFLRAAVIADAVILIAIFSFTSVSDFSIYRWPIVMIALLAGIIFAQALALLFSLPPEIKLQRSEKIAAFAALMVLVVAGALIFLKPSQERAVQKGGGLLEPKLFSFDFSQFLRLDTEISMSDDLIMIVKKDPGDDHVLTRRAVMSGYNKKQGFFRIEELDEKTHPQRLPSRPTRLFPAEFKMSQRVNQEYFLVNFDTNAFIGMKEPVEIIPYETWDASSFKSAFAVESLTSNAIIDIGDFFTWPDSGDFSEKEMAAYTAYGDDKRLQLLAEEITMHSPSYAEKVYAVYEWLKFGDFRYSFKPGIAPDGDQLAWFLFDTKRGYCTYYAFAMTLMLRSLGIPARVAAGFFVDPESGTFDYYPVRSDMAHAWVEVYFPGYGWLEFDPTTENLAEDEEFTFSAGVDPRLFERLMREILENRSRLKAKMGQDGKSSLTDTNSILQLTVVVLKKLLLPVLIISLIMLFVIIRCGYLFMSVICRNRRKKAVNLWKHARRRLRLAGYGQPSSLAESEWALNSDTPVKGTYAMYLGAAAARFAPEYQNEDFVSLKNAYSLFSESYRITVSPWRRFLAWVLPPLALVRRKTGMTIILLLLVFFAGDGRAQDDESNSGSDAGNLFFKAFDAELSEYWERAIELYKEGGALYPNDSRFPQALGRLYYSRGLYNLAWEEYRKAEMIAPYDTSVLFMLAHTAGYLNQDKTSVRYFEKVLALDPENRGAIGSLGWMYYKVHRLRDGEQLLNSAIEQFGESADYAMTLATVYSDMYRYNEGKYWYMKSIALAEYMKSFIAVAYYNLSILETRFYHYGLSMDASNASLDAQNRASGLLARGELNMRRLELEKAQSDFQEAREVDPSPLAKMNLAQTFQISGRLEEARLYALDCLKASDNSWMMHYGIDPVRYKKDLHDILHNTYAGFAKAERFIPCRTPGEKIRSICRSIYYRFYSAVHQKLYQKYSLAAGDDYETNDAPLLDQFVFYFDAFETYPRRALYYLNKARDFETALIPASEASYNLESGVLLKDLNLTARALEKFDPDWEGDLISQCYREFALRGKTRAIRQKAATELFALNRGALLQAGINLPVEINVQNAQGKEKVLRRALAKAGFIQPENEKARYRLDINIAITVRVNPASEDADSIDIYANCVLTDTEGGERPLSYRMPLHSLFGADIYRFAGELSRLVFRVE
jgi:transglutaminase-like putative cysteine protease/tetratricopeptide (TPR) repeat protein